MSYLKRRVTTLILDQLHCGYVSNSGDTNSLSSPISSATFRNWDLRHGEPNGGRSENCGMIYDFGPWNDDECSKNKAYICERSKFSCEHTTQGLGSQIVHKERKQTDVARGDLFQTNSPALPVLAPCGVGEFACLALIDGCIPNEKIYDGVVDCPTHEDDEADGMVQITWNF